MKKAFALLCALSLCMTNIGVVHAQETDLQTDVALQATENISAEDADEPVEIPDPALREAVAERVDTDENGIITKAEMEKLTSLSAQEKGIKSLEGLQYAKSLPDLFLNDNEISDLSPLAELEPSNGLLVINLSGNKIQDIGPLKKAINATDRTINLKNNQITDFSLLYGKDVSSTYVSGNPASDEEYLNLLQLPSDVTLENAGAHYTLMKFHFNAPLSEWGYTFESDETVAAFKVESNWSGDIVDIVSTSIGETTVYVKHGDAKRAINVHVKHITEGINIPDPALREAIIKQGDINKDGIITKTEMKELNYISAPNSGIKSLEGLQYAEVLPQLFLSGNEISDLSPLKDLDIPPYSTDIFLSNNKITDISPISKFLNSDDFSCLQFSLSNNEITDFSPIYGCDTYHLYITGNPASDEEYLRLLQLPSDLYLTERVEGQSTNFIQNIAFSYWGFEESLGITFYSDDENIATIGDINTYLGVVANAVGETTVYVQHGDVKHPIRVHVGSADSSANDVTAESVTYNELEHKVPLFSLLSPTDKVGLVSNFNWTSSNENIVKLYKNGQSRELYLETTGYGSATITGTSSDGSHTISFTVTVEEKSTPADGWVLDDNNWYYYENGEKVTGWKQVGSDWYYMYEDGKMASDTWIGDYYVNESGVWLTNLRPAHWVQDGDKWWYQNEDGSYPVNCWMAINGGWYYFDASGYMVTGWLSNGGAWYYLNSDGAMAIGWNYIDGNWYYLNSDGTMATGWTSVNGTWYYCNASGVMETGWLQLGSTWYYLQSDGSMLANQWLDGTYYFKADGSMAADEWVDNGRYYVDSSGKWVPDKTK